MREQHTYIHIHIHIYTYIKLDGGARPLARGDNGLFMNGKIHTIYIYIHNAGVSIGVFWFKICVFAISYLNCGRLRRDCAADLLKSDWELLSKWHGQLLAMARDRTISSLITVEMKNVCVLLS